MAGGDHVEVNLHRADAAASALEGLRDALAAHIPAILTAISDLRGEGADLPPPNDLHKLHGRAPQDASEMRTTARLATHMNNQLLSQQPPVIVTGKLDLGTSWDQKALDKADAKVEAQALKQAEDNKDPKASRAAIQAIQQDIKDHQDANDTDWLAAFYNQSAPQVAALAGILNRQDGKDLNLLSRQDQQILSTFGGGLAAAAKSGKLSQTAIQGIVKAHDPWSASMLVKYGPSGRAYGTGQGADLLAGLTRTVLNARENGTYKLPIDTSKLPGGPYDKGLLSALRNYDPTSAMLQRDSENKVAASQVLGGPDGGKYAHDLLNTSDIRYADTEGPNGSHYLQAVNPDPDSQPQGPDVHTELLDQNIVGQFLDSATQGSDPKNVPPRTGEEGRLSAQAAMNIIKNTPDPGHIDMASPVRNALMDTYSRYMPDIAASMHLSSGSNTPVQYSGGIWAFQMDGVDKSSPLFTFMKQICKDPTDAGKIQGETVSAMGNAFALQAKGISNPFDNDLAGAYASLYGGIITTEQDLGFGQKEQEDARNAEINTIVASAEAAAGAVPSPTGALAKAAWGGRGLTFPFIPKLSTDNASQQAAKDLTKYADKEDMLQIPLVQGLINQGVIPPTDPQTGNKYAWYQGTPPNGKVTPDWQFGHWVNMNHNSYLKDLPGFTGPRGEELQKNATDNQTLENWLSTYQGKMNLTRQEHTEEGN